MHILGEKWTDFLFISWKLSSKMIRIKALQEDVIFSLKAYKILLQNIQNLSLHLSTDDEWETLFDNIKTLDEKQFATILSDPRSFVENFDKNGAISKVKKHKSNYCELKKEFYLRLFDDFCEAIMTKDPFYTRNEVFLDLRQWIECNYESLIFYPSQLAYGVYHIVKQMGIETYRGMRDENLNIQIFNLLITELKKANFSMYDYLRNIVKSEYGSIYFSTRKEENQSYVSYYVVSKKRKLLNITHIVSKGTYQVEMPIKSGEIRKTFDIFCLDFFNVEFKCSLELVMMTTNVTYDNVNLTRRYLLF